MQAGSTCPDCLATKQTGKLSAIKPHVLVLLESKPLVNGIRYTCERLRCGLCGSVYTASLPDNVSEQPKYAPSCLAMLALCRYQLGLPMKRIERLQNYLGIPLPDATQWDKLQSLYEIIEPVYRALEHDAAQGTLIQYDDTPNRILSQAKDYAQGLSERKGIHTTVLISHYEAQVICLFYTGQCYASENFDYLLQQRTNESPFITMSDAGPNNTRHTLAEWLYTRWIMSFCLVHGRRNFVDLATSFPEESEFVLKQLALVYHHETHCQAMTPEARLAYHQQHSAPVMRQLQTWLRNQWQYEQVEENSGLGQAIAYMLRHWQPLTQFLHYPGVPLDNNLTERIVKNVIRHRKNSLFYKTTHGAQVGDGLMSIIETAIQNTVNPFDYLVTLQQHADAVIASPRNWLPWCYQTTIDESALQAA